MVEDSSSHGYAFSVVNSVRGINYTPSGCPFVFEGTEHVGNKREEKMTVGYARRYEIRCRIWKDEPASRCER